MVSSVIKEPTAVEVFQLYTGSASRRVPRPCRAFPDFPRPEYKAVGAVVAGAPTVCGGMSTHGPVHYNDCLEYDRRLGGWKAARDSMLERRYGAGAALIGREVGGRSIEDSEMLTRRLKQLWWVGGGNDGTKRTPTTEVYSAATGRFATGPALDLGRDYGLCLVSLNSTHSFAMDG